MPTISNVKRNDIPMLPAGEGCQRGLMLPGMMEGVETYKCHQAAGSRIIPQRFHDRIQIFFFTKGSGYIGTAKEALNITEVAVFIPMLDEEAFFIQAGTDLEYLNLIVTMNEYDHMRFNKVRMVLPRFYLLKDCRQYYEGFKGPSVKSYTIVEPDLLARISMGVVFSEGAEPATVGEHAHANLMQWYYGLDGCRFTFMAEGEKILVEDGDFNCIPMQAKHAVMSAPGERINYVWFEMKCHV